MKGNKQLCSIFAYLSVTILNNTCNLAGIKCCCKSSIDAKDIALLIKLSDWFSRMVLSCFKCAALALINWSTLSVQRLRSPVVSKTGHYACSNELLVLKLPLRLNLSFVEDRSVSHQKCNLCYVNTLADIQNVSCFVFEQSIVLHKAAIQNV